MENEATDKITMGFGLKTIRIETEKLSDVDVGALHENSHDYNVRASV